jgi:hypothetical protein
VPDTARQTAALGSQAAHLMRTGVLSLESSDFSGCQSRGLMKGMRCPGYSGKPARSFDCSAKTMTTQLCQALGNSGSTQSMSFGLGWDCMI